MKWILKLLAVAFMLQSFQCTDDKTSVQTIEPLTQEFLNIKRKEIKNYVNSFSCSATVGCSSIAFGSKPCGGPREYLLYPNSIDIVKLKQMVNDYNAFDNTFNIQTSAVSDCMLVTAPANVGCVNGVCSVIPSNAQSLLFQKKQAILDYIATFSCSGGAGCSSIAFGAKPCGGPREFLPYSNSVNLTTLQNMVSDYNTLDQANNIQTSAISDCAVVTAPANVGCVNGVCTIL